jgi:Ca-activated chloride channel family protein
MFAGRMAASRPVSTLLALSVLCLVTVCVHALSNQALAGNHAQENPSPPYAITQEVNLVALPVVVRDHRGHFVSGLKVENFKVQENGRPQAITLFRNEDIPVTAGLVVDHSSSMAARQLEVIEGAQAFVQASNPQDREFVVNFGETVSFGLPTNVAFTNDANVLRNALSTPYATGRTALYDAVLIAIQHLQEDDRDKKVLILISDGGDSASRHTLADVLRIAQTTGVVIYTIGLLDEHNADQNPKVLQKLAAYTGGEAYFPNSFVEVINVCREIAADIRHQYTLGYTPTDTTRPGYRKIHVGVTAPSHGKLFVRTRAGYFFQPKTPTQTQSSAAWQNP